MQSVQSHSPVRPVSFLSKWICAGVLCASVLGGVEDAEAQFLRGDVIVDDSLNLIDALGILNYLFISGPDPDCFDSADVNDDGSIGLPDALALLNYLFSNGAPPAAPFPNPGADPTADTLPGDCGGGMAPLPFFQVELGTFSGLQTQDTIIRDGAAWADFYEQHSPLIGFLPPVDFPDEMVIAIVRNFPSGGYTVSIDEISWDGTNIFVEYTQGSPLSFCPVTLAFTQPFHFIRCENVPGTLVLNETLVDTCP